jgi:hypothetical protein
MKKYVNGQYIELTPEEIVALQEEAKRAEEEMKTMPPTIDERLAAIESAILNILGVM